MITMDTRQLGGVEGRLGRELGDWKEKKGRWWGRKKLRGGKKKNEMVGDGDSGFTFG
jgi:hypothetical protein